MNSQSRAIVGFTLLGTLLVAIAWFVSGMPQWGSGVASLPTASTSAAVLEPSPIGPLPNPPPGTTPLLLQSPSLSKTEIAFAYAGEIWTVPREGGVARRLVTGQLENARPIFSPDGTRIAYTGVMDGNQDVYVVPASGGEPKRLTYHPGPDVAVGWTPDGSHILMSSWRATQRDLPQLYTLSPDGGPPEELPLPSGTNASYSPDAKRIAYIPFFQYQPQWREYRGGQTTPIWVADLSDSHIVKVPRDNSNDRYPMWVGNTVYFVSDRNGPFTLFAWDAANPGAAPKEVLHNPDGLDVRYASAGPGAIVYEQLGQLSLFDLATGATHPVPVTIAADLPQVRAHFEKVKPDDILHAAVSPTGKRVLFETHGEILALPADKGDVRNLTRSPAVADRDPAWSPDGKWIAWLSDADGEYALYFRSPDGIGPEKKVDLGETSFFYAPRWSPDSKKIVLSDKRLNLWLVDTEHPSKLVKIDTQPYEGGWFDPDWSPDSKWIVYDKTLENHFDALFAYSLADQTTHQLTDGRSEAYGARFDRTGKYIWFLSSTDVGLRVTSTMWAMAKPQTSSVYGIVLSKDDKSPVAPESDEENADSDKDKAKDEAGGKGAKGGAGAAAAAGKDKGDVKPVRIDFDGLDQRIVALPIDRANYTELEIGPTGSFFLLSMPIAFSDEDYLEYDDDNPPPIDVQRYDVKKRKTEPFADHIDGTFATSFDGKKVLYSKGKKWMLVDADAKGGGGGKDDDEGGGALKSAAGLEVWVDPPAEWKQIWHEVWRIERDFLYTPTFHGLDLGAAEKLYGRYVPGIAARQDLSVLIREALANLTLGHVRTYGGDMPKQDHVSVGLLGADYRIDQGHYQFAKILQGENWNPKLKAPLTQPGVDVKEGDYLLAINGEELRGDDDVSRLLMGRAGKQTVITVSARPNLNGARQVTVVPVGSEVSLRLRDWMEGNRKKVDELSGGRVGYVYLPDTAGGGLTNFDRYYFSEIGKDGCIIDERFNHGGQIADYFVDVLAMKPVMGATTREGQDVILPQTVYGPKVMLANEMSGSGGDALPWMFKKAGIGTLVGTRTWGGLVGIGGYPKLIDGATVTAPRWALYGTTGQWEVENHGITPDVEVEQDPALVRQGHDPQLEKAVAIVMDALKKTPPLKLQRPAYPDYHPTLPRVTEATPVAAAGNK